MQPGPTVIRGVLMMGRQLTAYGSRPELLDVSGRRMMYLREGANDVRSLAPGVYFVRSERSAVGGEPSVAGVNKVVVTR